MRWQSIENPPFQIGVTQVTSEATTRAWQHLQQTLPIASLLTGPVFTQAVFGVFFDAGVGFPVRMNITDFGIQPTQALQFPEDYPALHSVIRGTLAGFDGNNYQLVVRKVEG